jgi:hypothetical protein
MNSAKLKLQCIRCEAHLRSGKQCKNMSVPGYSFCRVHCFGRTTHVPWYYNPILHTLLAIGIAVFLGWFFFHKGPSTEKQDETLAIVRRMETFQKENEPELKAKFNLGYILFTATESKIIIPLNSPFDDIIKIDWKSGYSISLTEDTITLRLPNFTIHPSTNFTFRSQGDTLVMGRRIEPWARPGIFNNGKVRIAFKVVATNEDNVIIALGIQSPPEPKPAHF